jgi:hypothetical protein
MRNPDERLTCTECGKQSDERTEQGHVYLPCEEYLSDDYHARFCPECVERDFDSMQHRLQQCGND